MKDIDYYFIRYLRAIGQGCGCLIVALIVITIAVMFFYAIH